MPYIDFKEVKAQVSITQAADTLKLKLKSEKGKLRGECPACKGGDDRCLVLTPERGLFYCFMAREGGDCLELVKHITGLDVREAAEFLLPHTREANTPPQPHKEGAVKTPKSDKSSKEPFDPAAFAEKLEYSEEVKATGLSEDDAKALGVGTYRGKLYQALRYPSGAIAGYSYVEGGKLKPPKNLLPDTTPNVVPFKKKA